jgi:6-phosphofructo-2-kinase/fructose-2,6-biphosphatase 4
MSSPYQTVNHTNSSSDSISIRSYKGPLSPRARRRTSNVDIDAIHEFKQGLGPAQLYSTESGRLYYAGRILICTVGLPARGKTHLAVSLTRYLRWLGVNAHTFHLGDYRRSILGNNPLPEDYFFVNASPETVRLRQKLMHQCKQDMLKFFQRENGQIAIYDAVNPTAGGRRSMAKDFSKHDIKVLYLESLCEDIRIIEENVRGVKISSPDYIGWNPEDAVKDYLARIQARIPEFETMSTMTEPELSYIKLININERIEVNSSSQFGYIVNRVVFYLMNLHTKARCFYFARSGTSKAERSYKADAPLDEVGISYSIALANTITKHRNEEYEFIRQHNPSEKPRELIVWTSMRQRTIETAKEFRKRGYMMNERTQLRQLNPGIVEHMSEKEVMEKFPQEIAKQEEDPYHHRYPRAESYHDVAVRLEPVLMELERSKHDVLIIAHDTVLRVLYAYFMATHTVDIPTLEFPRNEVVEIIPSAYHNKVLHIPLDSG